MRALCEKTTSTDGLPAGHAVAAAADGAGLTGR
jgi:hypothetical protein